MTSTRDVESVCGVIQSLSSSAPGMLNFTHTDKEQRVHFMFKIFDTDHNGFLTEDELINILAASHMVGFVYER